MEQFFWEAFNIRGMRLSSRTRGFYPNNHMCHMGFNENAVISMWCTWRAPFCKSIKSEQFGIATQKEIECEIWPIFWGQITSKSSLYKAKNIGKMGKRHGFWSPKGPISPAAYLVAGTWGTSASTTSTTSAAAGNGKRLRLVLGLLEADPKGW